MDNVKIIYRILCVLEASMDNEQKTVCLACEPRQERR